MGERLQVRGSALWGRKEWVRRHHGAEGLEGLLPALSPAGRNVLRSDIDPTAWYNYPLFLDLAVALDRRFGDGDFKLNRELGRFGAHHNTPKLYSLFIRMGSVDWVLGRAAKLWREHFNAGSLVVETDEDASRAEAEVVDWPEPHLAHSYSVLGFAIGVIELSGAKNVTGELVSCRSLGGETTRLRVAWE
jgi:hypothetical protein